jgi:spoIIIJ-associated protein
MKLFFSGRNLQHALLAAARHFQLDPEDIAYSLRERERGFIKNPKTVIEVDPSAPKRSSQSVAAVAEPLPVAGPAKAEASRARQAAAAPAVGGTARPRPTAREGRPREAPVLPPETALAAAGDSAALLAGFAGLDVQASVELDSAGEILVTFEGPDAARLTANQGELLETLDHLLPRLFRGMTGSSALCRVDAAGFRAAREADLQRLALEAAEQVRRERLPVALPEMNPADRRIVHLTLEKDPSVSTASHGDGLLKSVTVSPA